MAVSSTFNDVVSPPLASALRKRGFEELTAVQQAVLDPALAGRDLRISSQTGSGKTVALGFVIAPSLERYERTRSRNAMPASIVVAPTRELAAQVAGELSWLLAPMKINVVVVTGGTGIGNDFRELARGPGVIVGTPGRLLDHIRRGSIDPVNVGSVVLDEADEMLDMGFRDELDGILDATPSTRRTHLVSATLPRDVLRLADRYQADPVRVAGSAPGTANTEISHVAHLVHGRDKIAALTNILLATPQEQTLIFVRTRVSTTEVAAQLSTRGFSVAPLSGEMGQRERNAALAAFREKRVRAIVATDVAARGLDVEDVARVIHFDLPESGEGYTHRSGRTGRAGRSGISVALTTPAERRRIDHLARRARVEINWRDLPNASDIAAESGRRLVEELDGALEQRAQDSHLDLAQSLIAGRDPAVVVAHLLASGAHLGPCAPMDVATVKHDARRNDRRNDRNETRRPRREHAGSRGKGKRGGPFVPFFVGWGAAAGANPRRLLAMVCRRGQIKGDQVGAIRIDNNRAVVDISESVAEDFARAAARKDPRNPKIKIAPWR